MYDPYQSAYSRIGNQNSFNYQDAMADKDAAAAMQPTASNMAPDAAGNVAKSGGNVPLAAGMTALDFIQKQQAAKIANAEAMKKARMAGISTSTDMMNDALNRYMQAVK